MDSSIVQAKIQDIKFDVYFDMSDLVVRFGNKKCLIFSYDHRYDTVQYRFTNANINKYEQELVAQYLLENYIGDIFDYNELVVTQL
jgi:hypothetical protein